MSFRVDSLCDGKNHYLTISNTTLCDAFKEGIYSIQELEKQSELKYPPTPILVTIGSIKNYFQRTLSQRGIIENVENMEKFAIIIYAIKRKILPPYKKRPARS
jgi:hypothetical protein